eukprot:2070667-Pleurochrysis_carterae.AAC.1
MIPQRVRNNIWPVAFATSSPPQGETPKEEYLYIVGHRQFDHLFDPSTTPPSLMDLPCVQTWQNKIAEKLEEP